MRGPVGPRSRLFYPFALPGRPGAEDRLYGEHGQFGERQPGRDAGAHRPLRCNEGYGPEDGACPGQGDGSALHEQDTVQSQPQVRLSSWWRAIVTRAHSRYRTNAVNATVRAVSVPTCGARAD